MANKGDFINFSSLGTGRIGNEINRDNPGSKGSAYIMVSPSFACWTHNDRKPAFGTEPKQWTNFQYWDGEKWVNVYAGTSGAVTCRQFNVNCSYKNDIGVTSSLWNYDGPTTPVLFQAKRIQGDGDRTHCRWAFLRPGSAGETWYNSYMKGKTIYGLSRPIEVYVASDGKGPATPEQFAMSNIQAQLPLLPKGQPVEANAINLVTCLPLGYTR